MKMITNFFLGTIFGFGLMLSQIVDPRTILSFLNFIPNWNPSLLFTIVGMLTISWFTINLAESLKLSYQLDSHSSATLIVEKKVLIGSVIFGVGFGLSGLTASTGLINLVFGSWQVTVFFAFVIVGLYAPTIYKKIVL